jgi:hypothetical protein
MPYKNRIKDEKKDQIKEEPEQPFKLPRGTQSHTHCIAHNRAPLFGAEGASASMADRAVRAARFSSFRFY